jgi:hypothetical protein
MRLGSAAARALVWSRVSSMLVRNGGVGSTCANAGVAAESAMPPSTTRTRVNEHRRGTCGTFRPAAWRAYG